MYGNHGDHQVSFEIQPWQIGQGCLKKAWQRDGATGFLAWQQK